VTHSLTNSSTHLIVDTLIHARCILVIDSAFLALTDECRASSPISDIYSQSRRRQRGASRWSSSCLPCRPRSRPRWLLQLSSSRATLSDHRNMKPNARSSELSSRRSARRKIKQPVKVRGAVSVFAGAACAGAGAAYLPTHLPAYMPVRCTNSPVKFSRIGLDEHLTDTKLLIDWLANWLSS
jgi:hypothetical protein